jgi:hypothetical protein
MMAMMAICLKVKQKYMSYIRSKHELEEKKFKSVSGTKNNEYREDNGAKFDNNIIIIIVITQVKKHKKNK